MSSLLVASLLCVGAALALPFVLSLTGFGRR
jgi:hypothetical protein